MSGSDELVEQARAERALADELAVAELDEDFGCCSLCGQPADVRQRAALSLLGLQRAEFFCIECLFCMISGGSRG